MLIKCLRCLHIWSDDIYIVFLRFVRKRKCLWEAASVTCGEASVQSVSPLFLFDVLFFRYTSLRQAVSRHALVGTWQTKNNHPTNRRSVTVLPCYKTWKCQLLKYIGDVTVLVNLISRWIETECNKRNQSYCDPFGVNG